MRIEIIWSEYFPDLNRRKNLDNLIRLYTCKRHFKYSKAGGKMSTYDKILETILLGNQDNNIKFRDLQKSITIQWFLM